MALPLLQLGRADSDEMSTNGGKHMDGDKTRRDELEVSADKEKTPPPDRDQASYSPARAQEKADRAEFPDTPGAQVPPDGDETLIARDNLKGGRPRSGSS